MLCERVDEVLRALKGALVILPAVTYANVGELAVDVIVSTLHPKALGALESANVLPAVGNDAYDVGPSTPPGTLSTALELFALEDQRLVILQQRAPAMLGRQEAFAQELAGWLAGAGAAGVLVLSGLDAQLRRDRQLDSSPFRFLASSEELRSALMASSSPSSSSPSSATSAPPPPQPGAGRPPPPAADPSDPDHDPDDPLGLYHHHHHPHGYAGSHAQPLVELEEEVRGEELDLHARLPPWPLLAACGSAGLPSLLLGCFASEGDNAGQGMALAGHALGAARAVAAALSLGRDGDAAGGEQRRGGGPQLQGAEGKPLRAPASWVGLYGRSFPVEIF